jgi:hypothetical protein
VFDGGDKEKGGIKIIRKGNDKFPATDDMKTIPNNMVVTAKFNIFNFLPLNIMN